MKLHKYTEQELRDAVVNSTSIRQVLQALNVAPYGGNYLVVKKAIKHFTIDTSHFTGQAWNKGKSISKRKLKDYTNNKYSISSHKLRLRLIKEGVFCHKCQGCSRKTWKGNPIPLELDHIDGDNKNNRLNNLRLLCPNCHALTPTYRGKNKSKA